MNYNFKKYEESLLDVSKLWQYEAYLEYKHKNLNVRIMFDGIGKHTELLSCQLTGYVGSGSGGMGFDLINDEIKKALEIKSCCTIQNVKCNKCGRKFNPILHDCCPHCQSTDVEVFNDSRFGIDAKETLNQHEKGIFNGFLTHCISLNNYTDTSISVNIKTYLIDLNVDEELKQIKETYFKNQATKGKKSHCNLLPNSYDFYKLCPIPVCSYDIVFDFTDTTKTPLITKNAINDDVRVPISIFFKKDIKKFKSLSSYDKNTNTVSCKDFTLNFDYKKKSFGKNRGDTRKNIYEMLNH